MSPVSLPSSSDGRVSYLVSLGVDPKAAATAAQSPKTYDPLVDALVAAGLGRDKKTPPRVSSGVGSGVPADAEDTRRAAGLVYTATVKLSDRKSAKCAIPDDARSLLFRAIGDGRIVGKVNLDAAVAYLADLYGSTATALDRDASGALLNEAEFERAAGVGVHVSNEQVLAAVDASLEKHRADIVERRYAFNAGLIFRDVMEAFKFVEGNLVRTLATQRLEELLGPKTEADLEKPAKQKKSKPEKSNSANTGPAAAKGSSSSSNSSKADAGMGDPEEDPFAGIPASFQARDLNSARNSPELIEKRRLATGGKIVCRFPPEPNGYLHVGHAKAMFLDFGFAKKMNGETILRFDDTNPVAEKTEYIDSIVDIVSWLGHKPVRITYSSDYFEKLYELALELIRRGKAYVCHQTGDEIKKGRENMEESPYRNRPMEESLRLFEDMRKGKFAEGEAILRMKIDMKSANSVMRDPIAYRVLHSPHPKTGDTWCVYPSYDYTHCIVDSLEWVTHSLCTLEFEIRRDSYYWLLEALDLYRPFVWEFARLSLAYTMMSKRKLKELVVRGVVKGWDDPRMPTLSGMRRRGYSPEAINRFCAAIGASRGKSTIGLDSLEHWVRADLDRKCSRAFAVLRPLKVVILNFRGVEALVASRHPKDPALGTRDIHLTETVFIESTDFRAEDSKDYYGLAPGKTAMLRHAYPITVQDYIMNDAGTDAVELRVTMDYEKSVKPKGVLHWITSSAPAIEVRMISTLFKSADPASLDKSEWLQDVNPRSMEIIQNARAEEFVAKAKVRDTFQFERTGYFACDDDSIPGKPVFNLVVSLRDSR
jgi:glutaminyl-tRNA synthetase